MFQLHGRPFSLTCAALGDSLPAVDEGGFRFGDLRRGLTGEGGLVDVVSYIRQRLAVDPAEGLDLIPGAVVVGADQSAVCQDGAVLCDDGAL